MSSLENIYNQNYGTVVCTNGDYVAVGNPVDQDYENCQGYGKIGQVLLYRKDNYLNQYKLLNILTNKTYSNNGTLLTYYTEQSSSAVFTASFITGSIAGIGSMPLHKASMYKPVPPTTIAVSFVVSISCK